MAAHTTPRISGKLLASKVDLYDQWTNYGTISVDSSSTVSLGDQWYASTGPSDIWKNSGALAIAPGATINLGDYFTTDEFESGFQQLGTDLNLSQYRLNLIAILDNTTLDNPLSRGVLTLSAATGTLFMAGGEINGGTVSGTAALVATSASGTLNDVVVDAAINLPASAILTMQGIWSTTRNGSITATSATLYLNGTWTNNGTISGDAYSDVQLGDYSPNGPSDLWKNSGVLSIAPGAVVALGDYFTTDEFESGFQDRGLNLNLSQYRVYIAGTLDNSAADNPITGGVLALNASTGPVYFHGQIDRGTITTSGANDLIAAYGTLDGVTLDGTLDMSQGAVSVMAGLVLDIDLYLSGSYATLYLSDGSTVTAGPLDPGATIHLTGYGASLQNVSGQMVTLGRGITISGENPSSNILGPIHNLGTIEQNGPGQLGVTAVVNDGSITASNGGTVTIDSQIFYINAPVPWINNPDGTITATQGGEVDLYDAWTNYGTITVDSSSTVSLGGSVYFYASPPAGVIWTSTGTLSIAAGATLNLGGYFTTDEFESGFRQFGAHLNLSQYTVNLTGAVDNSPLDNPVTGGTLALNQFTGSLYLFGTINQGTLTSQGSDRFVVTPYGSTLNGVTLDGQLDMSAPYAFLTVTNGLTLDTDLNIPGAGASVYFYDSTANTLGVGPLAQSATVHLSGDGATLFNTGIQTVIVDPGIIVSGESLNSSIISGPMQNLGTTEQNSAGQMSLTGVVNSGTVTVGNGGTLSAQDFANGRTVTIAAGGNFSTTADFNGAADYIQWAGTTLVDGLLSAVNVFINGGLLTGAGTIQANVTNAGTVAPGDTFGTLTIQGNYTQTAAGVLLVQMGGANQYGQLAVTGSAALAGTLEVALVDNYVPAIGTRFQILTFADYTGGFATETGLASQHHRHLKPEWDSTDLTLTASD